MLLTLCIAVPAVAALLVLFLPRTAPGLIRWFSLGASLLAFAVSLVVYANFQVGEASFQMVEKMQWIPSIGAEWHLGVDGISLFLIMLTTLLTVLCILSSWNSINERVQEYHFFFLLLEAGMVGVFAALDLFVFYVMWEVMLVPMFFLIGVWGGQRRLYATIKFFLFTMAGSVLMLAGVLYVYFHTLDPETGKHTFDLLMATDQSKYALDVQRWLFLAFGLAFAIKVPLFPLHTWLPDAHTEAPTAGLGDSCRCAAQDGNVRVFAVLLADVPAGDARICTMDQLAGVDRHHVRRNGGYGAKGHEEARSLFVRGASRVRDARHVCVK
ncbi:MAG: NADH-quinone oxidoreductase subunit M [bacterium]|nr:NADH-quinone oxidoreductase subunit M [bacterium]